MWSRFIEDRAGGAAPIFALGIIPIIGLVGAAMDYSRGNAARTAMLASLDATALMLARDAASIDPAQISAKATSIFNAQFNRPEVADVQVTANLQNPQQGGFVLDVNASGNVPTTFTRLLGHETLPIKARVSVATASDGLGCVLALNPSISGAITAQGTTAVNLNGCSLYDNSASDTALTVGGSATISTDFVGVVGGIGSSNGITATNGIRTKIAPVADPYADVEFPPFGGCDQNNYAAKNTVTINPGVFCGGITVNANAVLTMNPGMYYLDGGDLVVNGGASVTGTSVTLVFTSKAGKNWSTARINGNATVNLTPMTWGPTKGIVVFADRRTPAGTEFKFNGGANQYLGGAVYVPTGAISYAGGANTSTSCTQIIGDTVTFVGNSNLAIDCSRFNTRPFSTKVMRITS